jgi:hypothetical protein
MTAIADFLIMIFSYGCSAKSALLFCCRRNATSLDIFNGKASEVTIRNE